MRERNRFRLTVVAIICSAGLVQAQASEMFLKAQNYKQAENSNQAISLFNGTFEKSKNVVAPSRLQDVTIVMGDKVTKPQEQQWDATENFSFMRYETATPGTYVIGVSTKPRVLNFTRKQFMSYLGQSGIVADDVQFDEQKSSEPIRERYAKFARALVQVGDVRTKTYRETLGHPVEIVLDRNPYDLRFGDELGFQVLVDGEPAAGQSAKASCEGFHGHDASGGHLTSFALRTDVDGRAKFMISQKCAWYVSLVHLRKVDDPEADYESNWATITFEVR